MSAATLPAPASGAMLTEPESVKRFILGGNATFTLVSASTGKRFTFKMRKPEGKPTFVSLLTGSCNESDYSYLGTMFNGSTAVRHTRGSKVAADAPSAKALAWFLKNLLTANYVSPMMEFWHEGRCGMCGRKLTDPESIARGIGPVCADK
jgi:hypothetical protein